MTRRDFLTAAELTAVTVILAASLPMLGHAANYGDAWGAPALAGALVLTMLLLPVTASVLVILGCQQVRLWRLRREHAALPPSARTPLRFANEAPEFADWDRAHPQPGPAARAAEETQHAAAIAAVAANAPLPDRTPTLGYTAVIVPPSTGQHAADAQPWPWSPAAAERHVAAYATGETGARHVGAGPVPYAVRTEFDLAGVRTVVAERWAGRAA